MNQPIEDATQRFGKFMMWGLWLAILAVIFILLYASNRSENSITINGFSGQYSTSGKIDQVPVRFLLDTGATHVVISDELASVLDVENLGETRMETANGIATGYLTELDQIEFGPIKLINIDAIVNPAMDGKEVLLGMSALKQVEFTQKGSNLTVVQLR